MFANKRATAVKWFALTLLYMLVGQSLDTTFAQPSGLSALHVVTENLKIATFSVWQANLQKNQSQVVFSVDPTARTATDVTLSAREQSLMAQAIQAGDFSKSSSQAYFISYGIERALALDNTHLLLVTDNGLCDPFNTNKCFGYYELLILDTTSKTFTSILKFDYHPQFLDTWKGCSASLPSTRVYLDQFLVSPQGSNLAFSLTAQACNPSVPKSEVFLVDYSKNPSRVVELPMTGGLSWSPDGNQLAYSTKADCATRLCSAAVKVRTIQTDKESDIVSGVNFQSAGFPPTAWADNKVLVFQWVSPPSDNGADPVIDALVVQKNFENNTQITTSLGSPFSTGSVFYLNAQSTFFVGKPQAGSNQAGTQQSAFTAAQTVVHSADRVFFDSRHPNMLLLTTQTGCIDEVITLDTNLQQTSGKLSKMFPSDECAIYIAP